MKFAKGEHVMAKVPGGRTYQSAVVTKTGDSEYRLKLESDGKQYVVDSKNIKREKRSESAKRSPSKSPGRRPRSPSKSPSRLPGRPTIRRSRSRPKSSPSRSPEKRKSATRSPPASPKKSTHSPRRREPSSKSVTSPASPVRTTNRATDSPVRKSPSRVSVPKNVEPVLSPSESVRRSMEKEKVLQPMMENISLLEHKVNTEAGSSGSVIKRSARLSEARERSLMNVSISSQSLQQSNFYSGTSAVETVKSDRSEKSVEKEVLKPIKEFGGWFGALLLMLGLPLTVLSYHLLCTKDLCSIYKFNVSLDLKTYFNLLTAEIYCGFFLFQLVLAVLPLGQTLDLKLQKLGTVQKYRCNGFISFIITMILLGTLHYYEYPLTPIVDHYIPLIVTAVLIGYGLSTILYVSALKASILDLNMFGNTGNFIYDFWMGREVNPHFGRLNIKMAIMKFSIISSVVLHILIIRKNFEDTSNYSPTLLLAAALHIIYLADGLIFENAFFSTFEVKYEGTGCMSALSYALYPFISTIVVKYIAEQRVELSPYVLVAISIIWAVGYVIYRGSNTQKDQFRKNPHHPAFAFADTIVTQDGRKLLAHGWWSSIRHPNYFGDILMHWSWAALTGIGNPLPYIVAIMTTVLLVHRATRDEARCHQRYGNAWKNYCSRVKCRVIPYVF